MTDRHVAIVGGGYTGALLAIHLARLSDVRVTVIERRTEVARGTAYSTSQAEHLLNVRASRMSAFADEPAHFAQWLAQHGGDALTFAPRRLYGTYLQQLLARGVAEAAGRLEVVQDEVVASNPVAEGERLALASGRTIDVGAVVLALGNLPRRPQQPFDSLPGHVYMSDPWSFDIGAGLGNSDTVLLVGTGLTAVDAALTLDASGFQGRVVAMSRRGLVPRSHDRTGAHPPGLPAMAEGDLSDLVRFTRKEGERIGWRAAVDQLRPHTQPLWASATARQRERFLRHLRPYWDVHRHRIPREVADRIGDMEKEGRLSFLAGKIVGVDATGDGADVHWRPRGSSDVRSLKARRIVDCRGPELDIERSEEPLLAQLLQDGRVRPDPARIGIDVGDDLRIIDAGGTPSQTLYAAGPPTRGALWEIVAVPDLRVQAQRLAKHLTRVEAHA